METVDVRCPYCGEVNGVDIEWGDQGAMIQDCWVCCRPMRLDVTRDEWGDPSVEARTDDE